MMVQGDARPSTKRPPSGWYPPEGRGDSDMTATPSIQSSAPAISLATLRAVLAGMDAAHPARASRLVRAANIVAIRQIQQTARGNYWVQSECDPANEYMVVLLPELSVWTCTCRDFQQRGGPCKHALAVQMLQACEARERGPEPPPLAHLARRAYRDDDRVELTPEGAAVCAALDGDAA